MEKTAEASGDAFKIFQLYVRGDADWVDDHVRRAIDNGYDAFCFTIDTDSHSRRERDIAKRHQRRRARLSASDEKPASTKPASTGVISSGSKRTSTFRSC